MLYLNQEKKSPKSSRWIILFTVMCTLENEFDSLCMLQATMGTEQAERQKLKFVAN